MKKTLIAAAALMAAFAFAGTSCSGSDDEKDAKDSLNVAVVAGDPTSVNFRYVNMDTVSKYYVLAQEVQAEVVKLDAEGRRFENQKTTELANYQAQIQRNAQAGHYLTEESVKKVSQEAQKKEMETANQIRSNYLQLGEKAEALNKQLDDSLRNCIADVCAKYNFDAVMPTNLSLYVNPELDITQVVIAALNQRYKPAAPAAKK